MIASAVFVVVSLMCQLQAAQAPADDSATQEAIERAVEELGDARFSVRNEASRFLWQQGLQAEAALRQAARSDEIEVRLRAVRILQDFDYGILPSVPAEVLERIRQFRDGDGVARQQAVQALAKDRHWDTVTHLLRREANISARRGWLIMLFHDEAAIDHFATLEKITALVESVAPDQENLWQRGMVGELLFSPLMIQRLAAADQLSVLSEFLNSEKDPGVRTLAFNSVFNDAASINHLMSAGHWPLLREFVDAAPLQRRPQLLAQILGNRELVTQIIRKDHLDQLFELLTATLEAPNADQLLPQLFNSAAMPLILDQRGIDGMLTWLKRKQDVPGHGDRLAALMSSAAVQQWLSDAGKADLIVEIAAKELSPAIRRNYIRGLIQRGRFRSPQIDARLRRQLWELIKSDEDDAWQMETIVAMLGVEGMREIAADEKEAVWLLHKTSEASAEQRVPLLQALVFQNEWLTTVLRQGHLDALVEIIEKVGHPTQQVTLLGRVIKDPATVDYLKSKNQLERLIAMAKEKPAGALRTSFLQYLVANQPAIAALLVEGHYEALTSLIHATEDGERRAALFGSLASQNEVIRYLSQRNELGTLIDFAKQQDLAQNRATFLKSILGSDATRLLLEQGFYKDLQALIEDNAPLQDDLAAAFYGNSAVLRHFLQDNEIADLITLAESIGPAARHRILQSLSTDRELIGRLSEEDQFERLAALIAQHPDVNQRTPMFENLLRAPQLLHVLAMRDQLSLVLKTVRDEGDADARHQLLRGLVSDTRVVGFWTEADQLDQLVELTSMARDSVERADVLGRLVGTSAVLDHWSHNGQLGIMLDLADSFTEAEARHKYLQQVYSKHSILHKMVEGGLLEDLLEVAGRQPAELRGPWLNILARIQATPEFLRAEGQIVRLLSIATDEPDEAVRQEYYAGLMQSHAAVAALVDGGYYNPLLDNILSLDDTVQRSRLFGRLTQHSSVVTYLSQRNLLPSLLTYAETQTDEQAREAFLQAFFRSAALTALVEQGHYPRVRAIVEQESPMRDSLAALFYSNASVIDRLLKSNEFDELFQHINAFDQPARLSFLSQITSNARTTADLIRAGHLDSMLSLVPAAPTAPQRSEVLSKLLGSAEVLSQLAAKSQLQQVVDLAMQASDPNSQRMLAYSLTHSNAVDVWVRAEMIDELIQLVHDVSDRSQRADVLSRVVGTASVLRHWEHQDQLTKVFAPLDDLDAATRPEYLHRILANSSVFRKLVAAGLLEEVLEAIGQLPDTRARAVVLGWVAHDMQVTEQLVSLGQTARVFSFARDQAAEVQLSYLQGLLSNGKAVEALLKEGHYDTLAAWVLATEDVVRRANFYGLLMQQGAVVEHLRQRDELNLLVEFSENQKTAAARAAFLRPLFTSNTLALLIEQGYYDRLQVLAEDLSSQEAGASSAGEMLVASFYSHPKVLDRFPQPDQLQGIMQRVDAMGSSEARYQFLQRLFGNFEQLKWLIDKGQLESLVKMIRRAPENHQRQQLLGGLITTPGISERLAAQQDLSRLLEILRNEPNDDVREGLIGQVVSNRDMSSRMVGAGLLPVLVTLIEDQTDDQQRGELLGKLLGSSAVAEYLVARGDLDTTMRIVQRGNPSSTQHALRAMTLALLREPKTLSRWIGAGLLEPLIELLIENTPGDQRADLLVPLVTAYPVLEQWSKDERLGSILDLAGSLGDGQTRAPRQKYLTQVFNHSVAVRLMVKAGMFEDLLDVAQGARQTDRDPTLLVSLLASPFVAEQLRSQGRMELMVELVVREEDELVRDLLLAGVLRNDAAVKGLIEAEQINPLIDAARQLAAADESKAAMSHFLRSAIAVEYLGKSGKLDAFARALFDDLQHDLHSDFSKKMLRQGPALMAFERVGLFDDLIQAIVTSDAETRRALLNQIVNAQGGAQLLVQHDRTPLVISTLQTSIGQHPEHSILRDLLGEPQFLKAVAERKMLGLFLDQVETIDREAIGGRTYRRSVWEAVNWSSDALMVLAENDQLERLLRIASEEPRPYLLYAIMQRLVSSKAFDSLDRPQLAERLVHLAKQAVTEKDSRAVQILLNSPGLRKTLIADGKVEVLRGLLPMVHDERQREQYRQQISLSASGVVAHRVSQADVNATQKMLEEQAAKSDEGIAILASFLLTQGRLEQRIEELQREDDPPARMLAYLHRANGDLDAALAEATRSGDTGLIHYLTCEQRDWLSAAKQLTAGNIPPPVPLRRSNQNDPQAQIERLSFLAAYWRLGGDAEQAAKIIEEVEKFAAEHKDDQELQWCAAEALLLNDFSQPGLVALQRADPVQAFEVLVAQHRYSSALEAIGCVPGSGFDRDWYLALPQAKRGNSFASELNAAQQRMGFAMRIVEVFHQLGLEDDVERILLTLEGYIQEQPESTSQSPQWRRMHEQWMAAGLYRIGFHQRAWRHAERAMQPTHATSVLYSIFAGRGDEAHAWWTYFGRGEDEPSDQEKVEEKLRRVHDLLYRQLPRSREDFERLVELAVDVDSLGESQLGNYLAGLAETCIDRARPDLAERLLRQSGKQDWPTRMKLANVLRQQQKWAEAGEVLLEVWQANEQQVTALYLSGDSLVRAGDAEEGERRKELAGRLVLPSAARCRMASAIAQAGLADDAAEQWKIVLRTAPLASWEWHSSVRRLADHVRDSEPALAADLWEQYSLSMLRSNLHFSQLIAQLRMSYLIRWRRAAVAIQRDDTKEALHQARWALAALPGDTEMVQHLITDLEEKGDNDAADQLHDSVRQHYLESLQQFPASAHLHNELAWHNARSHRDLDEALEHARRAVEIRPRHGGHIDTLAEVHFQRGERERAIELSQQSLEFAPANENFRRQLDRFRNDPLPDPRPKPPSE